MIPHMVRGYNAKKPGLIDGEIVEVNVPTIYAKGLEDRFVRTQEHLFTLIEKLDAYTAFFILWIQSSLEWNTGVIHLSKFYKTKIMKMLNISLSTLDRCIAKAKELEILVSIPNSSKNEALYYANPIFFWKGDDNERKRQAKVVMKILFKENLPDLERQNIEAAELYQKAMYETPPPPAEIKEPATVIPLPKFNFSKTKAAKDEVMEL